MLLEPFENACYSTFELLPNRLELNAISRYQFLEYFRLVEDCTLDFLDINVFDTVLFKIVMVRKSFSLFFVHFESFMSDLLDALDKFKPFDPKFSCDVIRVQL